MDAVTTSIDGTTGGVKIQWTAPNSNADTITSYLIEIYDPVTLDWHTNSNCDGTQATVISNLYCIVPMSVLQNTLQYSYGGLI